MITKSDIELICNYSESSRPSLPLATISYLELIEEDNEEQKLTIKRENRGLVIDAILGGKEEEELFNKSTVSRSEEGSEEGYTRSISSKLMSVNVKASKFQNMDILWVDVLTKIESLTSNSFNYKSISHNLDYTINKSEDFNLNSRRMISKISMCGSIISNISRVGPAKTIICGYKASEYIISNTLFNPITNNPQSKSIGVIMGMNVIISNIIKTNKIVVMRTSSKVDTGLNVINNINDGTYFMTETPGSWNNMFVWFDVI